MFRADADKLGDDVSLTQEQCFKYFAGYGHALISVSRKSKRTACSSSHGESTAAQAAMLGPVSALQKKAPCVIDAIGNTMLPDIRSLLTSFMDNVENPTSCMSEQFTGAIFNKILVE